MPAVKRTADLIGALHELTLLVAVVRHAGRFAELIDAGGRGIALMTGELDRLDREDLAAVAAWENEGGAPL